MHAYKKWEKCKFVAQFKHETMRTLVQINDPVFEDNRSFNGLDQFFLKFINDKRDLPFIYLSLQITLTVIPFAVFLFTPVLSGWIWWVAALVYAVWALGILMAPFILMLHNTSHNKFFKQEYNIMNKYIPWVLGPFMGQTPETYYSHHVGMHHAENNLDPDESSTMRYQRDNIWHFLHYFFKFMIIGIIKLSEYFYKRQKWQYLTSAVRGEVVFMLLCVGLSFISFKATFIVFILPVIIARFAMMAGNWGQHAFIDATRPGDSFVNSISCINTVYNKKCFNDGYHIGHHLHPRMHWTDMPRDFMRSVDQYVENQCVVFEGVDYFAIWFMLMTKQYNKLASHFVNLGNQFKSQEEVVAFLKSRTAVIKD
jgi:fatty acid desaturase